MKDRKADTALEEHTSHRDHPKGSTHRSSTTGGSNGQAEHAGERNPTPALADWRAHPRTPPPLPKTATPSAQPTVSATTAQTNATTEDTVRR